MTKFQSLDNANCINQDPCCAFFTNKLSSGRFFLIHISICLAKSFILRLPCITLADFTVIHKDRSINGNVIREIRGVDDIECTKQCAQEPRCRSYNIQSNLKICQLNEKMAEDFGSQLLVKFGWIYKSTDYNETQV